MGAWKGLIIMVFSLIMVGGVTGALVSSNWNEGSVQNGPQYPVTFTFEEPFHLLSVETYHWNDGQGVAQAGSIRMTDSAGTEFGPWQASGSDGSGGIPNAIWTSTPDETFPAGTYAFYDSDPDTWSQNAESGYTGFTRLRYEYSEEKADPVPSDLLPPIEKTPPAAGTQSSGGKVIDSTFTSGIDENTQPVDRKNEYLTSDERVYFWLKSGPYDGGEKIEMVWFDPAGNEFYHSESYVDNPNEFGYDYWVDNYQYSYLNIAGKRTENLPGTWRVDLYIDGEYVLSDEFTLNQLGSSDSSAITPENQPVSPESGVTPDSDKEELDLSFLSDYAFILNSNAKFEEANEIMDQALVINPYDPSVNSMKGWALMGLSQNEKALEYLDKSLSSSPDDSFTLTNKAYCLIQLGRCSEAGSIISQLENRATFEIEKTSLKNMRSLCGASG